MKQGRIIWKAKTRQGNDLTICYPSKSDAKAMWKYINALSKEKTFLRFQGEEISLAAEEAYLNSQLAMIAKHEAVLLLVLADQELIGIAGVEMQNLTEKHIGIFGISITKAFRGEGIGSLLMRLTLEEAVQNLKELEMITLCVFSSNSLGIEMYKKFGFVEYGVLPKGAKLHGAYADQILMVKSVK